MRTVSNPFRKCIASSEKLSGRRGHLPNLRGAAVKRAVEKLHESTRHIFGDFSGSYSKDLRRDRVDFFWTMNLYFHRNSSRISESRHLTTLNPKT